VPVIKADIPAAKPKPLSSRTDAQHRQRDPGRIPQIAEKRTISRARRVLNVPVHK
jgi:hypothetical protein